MQKNITFIADANTISQANAIAQQQQTTLNVEFCRWLARYAMLHKPDEYKTLMGNLSYVCVGNKFSREQLNER